MANVWAMLDKFQEGQHKKRTEIKDKQFEDIQNERVETKLANGSLDYAVFRGRRGNERFANVLRIFRVESASNLIRDQLNNEGEFEGILKKFGKERVSFVAMYAHKPGYGLKICYGVLVSAADAGQAAVEKAAKESKMYLESLKAKFSAGYQNIELKPLNLFETWVFEGFNAYEKMVTTRGVPRRDTGMGIRPRPGNAALGRIGQQEIEIFLKGATNLRVKEEAIGFPFVMYAVMEPADMNDIRVAKQRLDRLLSMVESAKHFVSSESDSLSTPVMLGMGFSDVFGETKSHTVAESEADGTSHQVSQTHQEGQSEGTAVANGTGEGEGSSKTAGTTRGTTENHNVNKGLSMFASRSEGNGTAENSGTNQSEATNKSLNKTHSETSNFGKNVSNGESVGNGTNHTRTGSVSDAAGTSNAQNQSANIAAGAAAGESISGTRQQADFFNETDVLKYREYRDRMGKGLADGVFDFRLYVLVPDEETQIISKELLKQSFIDCETAFPIRTVEFEKKEHEKRMLGYAKSFEKPLVLEKRLGIADKHLFSTYARPIELSAFDLPQTNLAGYICSHDPVPEFSFPGPIEGDGIEIGPQWNPVENAVSPYPYKILYKDLGHILMTGGTGKGKTVMAKRLFPELHNKYDMNVLMLDWAKNYRSCIGLLKNQAKFRYNSCDPNYFPLKFNPIATPPGVPDDVWDGVVAELLCYSMGLGSRSFMISKDVMDDLKAAAQVAVEEAKAEAIERGETPTLNHIIHHPTLAEVAAAIEALENTRKAAAGGRMDFNEQSTFSSMKERLQRFKNPESEVVGSGDKGRLERMKKRIIRGRVQKLLCEGPFMSAEDLVKGDFFHLIECADLPGDIKQFVINTVAASIFYYCRHRDVKLSKPTYIVFEEAHAVMQQPTGNEPLSPPETVFEIINREARNYNLFIGYICQSPVGIPPKIFANSPIKITFQLAEEEAKQLVVSAGGKDPIRQHRDFNNWLSRQPRLMCVVRNDNFDRLTDGEFVAVKAELGPSWDMGNAEFKELLLKHGARAR